MEKEEKSTEALQDLAPGQSRQADVGIVDQSENCRGQQRITPT